MTTLDSSIRLGTPYGKTVGLAILAYKAPETTRASIENHLQHGLYNLFDQVTVCFQSVSSEDLAMAKSYNIMAIGRPENYGIQGGFRWAWEILKTDYILILENDIPICVDSESMKMQLQESMRHLEAGEVDLVRLRNRFNPGEQNRFASMYSRFWPIRNPDPRWNHTEILDYAPKFIKFIRRTLRPDKAQRWSGRSPYIECSPERLFPRWIKRIGEDFLCVDSWVLPWTNQCTLISHEKFGELLHYAERHPAKRIHNSEGNKLPTLETPLNCLWWRRQHLRIGLPEGIFTHHRLDRGRLPTNVPPVCNTPLNPNLNFITEMKLWGKVSNLQPFYAQWSASGATFWRGIWIPTGEMCFLKRYATFLAQEAKAEQFFGQRLAGLAAQLNCKKSGISTIKHLHTLSDGSIVAISAFMQGELLMNYTDKARSHHILTPAQSHLIRDGLFELARLLIKSDICHRDINPKNLMLSGERLILFDFQTAIYKQAPIFRNPDLRTIRSTIGLGNGYNPCRGCWNDIFSIAKTFEELLPKLSLTNKEDDLKMLYKLALDVPSISPRYIVDSAWKQSMRPIYNKLSLRPRWTFKPSSREKRECILNTLHTLLRE